VGLWVLHLEDVQLDLLAGELLEVGANTLGLGTATSDDDARASRVDVNANAVTGALDLDAADAGTVERLAQVMADLDVLGEVVSVTLPLLRRVREPARHVIGGDPEAEAVGMNLLAHLLGSLLRCSK